MLCFDDPLSISPCHLNCVPTDTYCADWRYLLTDPPAGLKLLQDMCHQASAVASEQFWGDDAFRLRFLGGEAPPSVESIPDLGAVGFNFPPSIFQLHLQFMHPPWLPFHIDLLRKKKHVTLGRFFPLPYVCKVLRLGDAARMAIDDSTPIEDIIAKFDALGVNYADEHAAMITRVMEANRRFAPWKKADFQHVVHNGAVYDTNLTAEEGYDVGQMQKEDTRILQSYGRSRAEDGQTSCTYYRFAKKPAEVCEFSRWSV